MSKKVITYHFFISFFHKVFFKIISKLIPVEHLLTSPKEIPRSHKFSYISIPKLPLCLPQRLGQKKKDEKTFCFLIGVIKFIIHLAFCNKVCLFTRKAKHWWWMVGNGIHPPKIGIHTHAQGKHGRWSPLFMILNKMAESFGVTFMAIMDHENDTLVNASSQVSPMHVIVSISHSKGFVW